MTTISKRQKKMMEYLLEQSDYVTIHDMALQTGVSARTCRTDLLYIDDFLKQHGFTLLRKSGTGICIDASQKDPRELLPYLDEAQAYAFDRKERTYVMILYLLLHGTTTFQELADACFVSKQTVINHFDKVEAKLAGNGIRVAKLQGKGLMLKGLEKNIRLQFLQVLEQNSCRENLYQVLEYTDTITCHLNKSKQLLEALQQQEQLCFVDQRRIRCIIAFTFYRIDSGHSLRKVDTVKEETSLTRLLKQYLPSGAERYFIASLIHSERIAHTADIQGPEDEATIISRHLIASLDKLHKIEQESFRDVIAGLTVHLRAAIYRSRNHITVQNTMLNKIQTSISLMMEFTRKELKSMESKYQLHFDENEIAYIAMYLSSIYETSFKAALSMKILIICSFGLATSAVLKLRIQQTLPECDILGPYSLEEGSAYLQEHKVNLIISANEFHHASIPVIVVDPLLHPKDMEMIRQKLYQESYSLLCANFLRSYDEKEDKHRMCDYLSEATIQLQESSPSWIDAIQLAARPLLEKGIILQSYVDEMIHAVNQYGTYMVLTPEVAYVHAGVNDGIYENCTAMLWLKRPLLFGSFNKKWIRAIIVLGIKHKTETSDLLHLAYILEKQENIDLLKRPDVTAKDILRMHD